MGRKKKIENVGGEMPPPDLGLEAQIIAAEKESAKPESDEKKETRGRKSKLDSLFSDEIIGELLGYPFEVLAENFVDERFKLKESQKQMFGYLIDATAAKANFRPSEYPQAFLLLYIAYLAFEKFWIYKKYHSNANFESSVADNGKVGERQDDVYEKSYPSS